MREVASSGKMFAHVPCAMSDPCVSCSSEKTNRT